MQASGEKEEIPDHVSESLSTGKRSQQFVYPARSLLGPLQPYGDKYLLDAMLSPPVQSAQIPFSERPDGSYFTHTPVIPSTSRQTHIGGDETHNLLHFPREAGSPSLDSRPMKTLKEPNEHENVSYINDQGAGQHIPYQIQEQPNPSGKGDMTVIQDIKVQAPQPVNSSPGVAQALQEFVGDVDPPVTSDDATPLRTNETSSLMSSNDADDEMVDGPRATSSLASSEVDFASTGLVHLLPITRIETDKLKDEWRGGILTTRQASSVPSSQSNSQHQPSRSHPHSQAWSSLPKSSIPPRIDEEPSEGSNANKEPAGNSNFNTITSSSNDGHPPITMRFRHKEDEYGHQVFIGREGKLAKCEDEPIRTPGAVQRFGVLMVVHDDHSSGQMKVRQVSENSKAIFGLSPRYLFALGCISNVLPSAQADILRGNIHFLNDPDVGEGGKNQDEHPQVFLLSGWGEPDTALENNNDPENRRQWTCWVAAHRLRSTSTGKSETSASGASKPGRKLIILEFELESDVFNPLYPIPETPKFSRANDSSPLHFNLATTRGSNSGSGTEKTERGAKDSDSSSPAILDSLPATPMDTTPRPGSSQTQEGLASVSTALATQIPAGEVVTSSEKEWIPSAEAISKSTTSCSQPLRSLERMRHFSRFSTEIEGTIPGAMGTRARLGPMGTMDGFTVLQEVNEQFGKALDLVQLLDIVVGIIKDLTQFHRVMCYQFDELWNGQVVSELVDWNQSQELFMGLHFPASDIPAQARNLYALNRVRLLYDQSQSTARLVAKDRTDLEPPVDMSHCYLRAMSPIHIKYLRNMGVQASMSISIVAFNKLWGLVACHSYGNQGMRVSFPVRQILHLLSDSISRNVERLSYAQRLRTRKLISTVPTDQHPTGYIVSSSQDLLTLFDADCGVLVIGEGAKIMGPNENGQDILLLAEYLRVKQFTLLQVSQSVMQDYPDLQLPSGLDVISGLLYVPLSVTGKDFIALLRKGQTKDVNWAGKPPHEKSEKASLEPRKSFKIWSERLTGRCLAWTDEQLDTAAVLALVYGKFIEVWRQKESAMKMNQMTTLLLSNASHEVRTPLHQIINYLELALDGAKLDKETRENLIGSHVASKALLFTINDLLDLTRLEVGKETSFSEPFDLHETLTDAVNVYRVEATRRQLEFILNFGNVPKLVVGDARKIKTVIANLTSNAVKYTQKGSISVTAHTFEEPDGLRALGNVAVEIIVSDTGCGIQLEKLKSIFREFEQVDNVNRADLSSRPGLGLGLAVVARVVEQLGGQLRVDSKIGEGSRFSCLLPFPIATSLTSLAKRSVSTGETGGSEASNTSDIDGFVEALSSSHMGPVKRTSRAPARRPKPRKVRAPSGGKFQVEDSTFPVRGIKVDEFDLDSVPPVIPPRTAARRIQYSGSRSSNPSQGHILRILLVEDDLLNARMLKKRLSTDGHGVVAVLNGQQAVDLVEKDRNFDCILMDIQMPILDGFAATHGIRKIEAATLSDGLSRRSTAPVERIPIFAVSASLNKDQRPHMIKIGMDGWILKPINFKRMSLILSGIHDIVARTEHVYEESRSWECGGWLQNPESPRPVIGSELSGPGPSLEPSTASGPTSTKP